MLKGQISFFAIAGFVMVVITAAMLTTTSRITATTFEAEAVKQRTLNEDRIVLEWYMDELIRAAMLESINSMEMENEDLESIREKIEEAAEERIEGLFDNAQFNKRGAGVLKEKDAFVNITVAEKNIVAAMEYPVILQRAWGETGISSRSVKIDYNLNRLYRFAGKIREDIAEGKEVIGEQEFEDGKFTVAIKNETILIKDYSLFWKGRPIRIILK